MKATRTRWYFSTLRKQVTNVTTDSEYKFIGEFDVFVAKAYCRRHQYILAYYESLIA